MSIQTLIDKVVGNELQTYATSCDLKTGKPKSKYVEQTGGCRPLQDKEATKVYKSVEDKCDSQQLGHNNLLNVKCEDAAKDAKAQFYKKIGR